MAFEVAASLALVSASALMVTSALRMLGVDFGMETRRVPVAGVGLRARAYPDPDRRSEFFSRVAPRLARVPGVESVTLTDWWPLPPPRRRLETDGTKGAGVVQAPAGVIHRGDIGRMSDRDAIKDQLSQAPNVKSPQNLEDYWIGSVGRRLYEKFIEKYSRKMWLIDDNRQIDTFNLSPKGVAIKEGSRAAWDTALSAYPHAGSASLEPPSPLPRFARRTSPKGERKLLHSSRLRPLEMFSTALHEYDDGPRGRVGR